jgi:hypothetical protein
VKTFRKSKFKSGMDAKPPKADDKSIIFKGIKNYISGSARVLRYKRKIEGSKVYALT